MAGIPAERLVMLSPLLLISEKTSYGMLDWDQQKRLP